MDASPIHSSQATSPLPPTYPEDDMACVVDQANSQRDGDPASGASQEPQSSETAGSSSHSGQDGYETGATSDGYTADYVEMDSDLANVS